MWEWTIARTAAQICKVNKMDNLIYQQETINIIKQHMNYVRGGSDEYYLAHRHIIELIEVMPPTQPTLYGYNIELLAYIARVMEKEGITAEYAVKTFDDMKRAVKMILDEAQQEAEEKLNEQLNLQTYKEGLYETDRR